jgi:hypothetical protein
MLSYRRDGLIGLPDCSIPKLDFESPNMNRKSTNKIETIAPGQNRPQTTQKQNSNQKNKKGNHTTDSLK